ncbi:hypothetical protein BD769DRAFT_1662983 [Suillus cothurnatus]|nr:hypothetical protein BD769DRAFT_1662983 [Suillus cothurnatus]
MTSTLVECIPAPPPAQFHHSVLLKHPQSQPKSLIQSKVAMQPWVTQLVHLPSQYHLSEYNRIKHGHRGCPIPYAPLLLNAPDTFRELRVRQATNMNGVLWWPCPQVSCATGQVIPTSEQRNALVSGSACPCLDPLLQKELNAALEDTLSSQMSPPTIPESISYCSMPVKTSITHPLNISTIVPPELLPAISSHLITNPEPSPVIFHIPDFYTLYRITDYAQHVPSTSTTPLAVSRKAQSRRSGPIPTSPSIPAHCPSPDPRPLNSPLPIPPVLMNQPPQSIIEALQAAIDTRLTTLATKPRPSLPFIAKLSSPAHKHNTKVRVLSDDLASNRSSSAQRGTSSLPKVVFPSMLDFLNSSEREQLACSVASQNTTKLRASSALLRPTSNIHRPKRCFKLGNLMLSSVSREEGCLDDEELEFLGIQWSDYVSSAHRAGMDILRIPLPEGLAPLSPQSLDESLTKLIDSYTMRGASILVHCRGGLGRAGLVACCWALKIGLCGWINVDLSPNPAEGPDGSESHVRRDTLQLVERAITVIRRRRSVRFLTEYVDFLREGAGRMGQL